MIDIQTLPDIETLSESIDLECKLAAGKDGKGQLPTDFWPTYSAFSNTHGGVVLLGVKEKNGRFSLNGLLDPQRVIRILFNHLNNLQKVSCNLLTDQHVSVIRIDGKDLIQIHIPAANRKQKPVYLNGNPFKGNTYRRLHEGDRPCSDEIVKRMLAEQVEDERDGRILPGYSMADIDGDSLLAYRQMLRVAKPGHVWLEDDDVEFLKRLKGWRRDRQTGEEGLTLAGLLMFGNWGAIQDALPHYFVDYQERPEAKTEMRWIDRLVPDGTWSGNLFDFYRRVYRKLTTDIKVPFTLKDGQRQEDTPVHEAIREALVNTLVHADYTGRLSVLVVKRPDLFGFRNPGNMRISVEQAIQGGESDCRNRIIHQMFLMIGLGERAGSGVPKIFSGWKSCDWRPPALYEKDEPEQTLLELRMLDLFPSEVVSTLRTYLGSAYDGLSELERLILATVATEQVATHNRIMEISTDHSHDLTQAFGRLVKAGWLKSSGHGRGTVYHRPGGGLPTPEQVFGEALPVNTKSSSDHFGLSSEHLELSSEHLNDSSEHLQEEVEGSQRTSDGFLQVRGLSKPLIDNPETLSQEVRQKLLFEASEAQEKKKMAKKDLEAVILKLCDDYYITLKVLAKLVNRTPDALRQRYLKILVEQGKLKLAFPTAPNHPQQAYTTVQESRND
jgi:predicted HTH transcriptional regulator